jgi:hypothetical protein
MIKWTLFYVLAVYQATTNAIPTITYPINSQVPPVARLSEPFSYTFSISTFFSYLPITYTLSNAPSWLSLDSGTRTLSGTPTQTDVGDNIITAFEVVLTASDQSGSVSLKSTLVISNNQAPVVNIPISSQLPYLGSFNAPSTLLLRRSTPFRLDFQRDTFLEGGSSTALFYYATTTANTPLPSWLTFDAPTLSFSGQAPDYSVLIGIQIIASDVEGFSGSSVSFEMAVGTHTFAFSSQNISFEAIPGADIKFRGLAGNIELDGQRTDISSIASITAQTPSWLNFDNSTLTISGHTPTDAKPCNVSVHATDIYGDVAEATISVGIGSLVLPTPQASANPHATTIPTLAGSRKHFSRKIIAAIMIPIFLLILVILVALLCYRSRRQAAGEPNRLPYTREKYRFSPSPDAEEIAGFAPNVPPKCLQLDALKYEKSHCQSPCAMKYTGDRSGSGSETKPSMEQAREGSFVSSALVPEPLCLHLGENKSQGDTEYTLHTQEQAQLGIDVKQHISNGPPANRTKQ